jgi:hypothetical protein
MNTEKKFYQSPRSTRAMRIFWKAAGADRYLLEQSTYGDQIKYVCLGGIIIATGVMAAIAGGYAFYTIFEPKGNAIDSFKTVASIAGNYDQTHWPTALKATIFGVIWGLIIFNIDRFIVTSTGKGDGTEAITKKEFVGALPRLVMGAIIALTISKPVEIRMFKTEIDVALHEKQIQQQQSYKANIDSVFNSEIKKKENEIARFLFNLKQLDSMAVVLQDHINREIGTNCLGRCQEYKDQLAQNRKEKDEILANTEYKNVRLQLDDLEKRRNQALNESEKVAAGLDGLLERIKLAHEKAGWIISLFITLLFMTIELTPIFFKLMLIKSPYDYMEENVKELLKAQQGIEIKHNYYPEKEGIERDLVINHEVVRVLKEKIRILETQSELSAAAIDSWKEKKKEDIAKDPESFIKEENA